METQGRLRYGTSSSAPRAAWEKLIGTWQQRSLRLRSKNGCFRTTTWIRRLPRGAPGSLKSLWLMRCGIGPAGAQALSSSPQLGGLESLVLWHNRFAGRSRADRDARAALQKRFGKRVTF